MSLHTVGSVTLACRSHSSTSLPGLILTQTHSWAQSCLAHQQCCHATSKLSQHMDWQPNCTMADKEPQMSNKIAGYELIAGGAAGSTFVSNYFQPFLAIFNPFQPFKEMFSHSNTFPSMSRHILSFVTITSPFKPLSFFGMTGCGSASLKLCACKAASPWSQQPSPASQWAVHSCMTSCSVK